MWALSTAAFHGPAPSGRVVVSTGPGPPPTMSPIASRAATSAAPSDAAASDPAGTRRPRARKRHAATASAADTATAEMTAVTESPPNGSYDAVPAATTTPRASHAGPARIGYPTET